LFKKCSSRDLWNGVLRFALKNAQGLVPPIAQTAIDKMFSAQEGYDRASAGGNLVHQALNTGIPLRVLHSHRKSFHGVLAAACGDVDLSEIQVELRLIALQTEGVVTELFGFGPFFSALAMVTPR
jgi:hypothetical protein